MQGLWKDNRKNYLKDKGRAVRSIYSNALWNKNHNKFNKDIYFSVNTQFIVGRDIELNDYKYSKMEHYTKVYLMYCTLNRKSYTVYEKFGNWIDLYTDKEIDIRDEFVIDGVTQYFTNYMNKTMVVGSKKITWDDRLNTYNNIVVEEVDFSKYNSPEFFYGKPLLNWEVLKFYDYGKYKKYAKKFTNSKSRAMVRDLTNKYFREDEHSVLLNIDKEKSFWYYSRWF